MKPIKCWTAQQEDGTIRVYPYSPFFADVTDLDEKHYPKIELKPGDKFNRCVIITEEEYKRLKGSKR